jgi:hypothetical protein
MKATIHVITAMLLFTAINAVGQVTGVKYFIKYNTTTCNFDCYIKITAGAQTTTNAALRAQFNSQYSVVAPFGTTVNVVQNFMPLQGNLSGTCTNCQPAVWTASTTVNDDCTTNRTYVSITPSLSPTPFYNIINLNDEIKLFSISVTPFTQCADSIRLYINGVDPSSSSCGMQGGDFSQGFGIGGTTEDFQGLLPNTLPPQPVLSSGMQQCIDNTVSIDLNATTSECQSPLTYAWTGPANYTSTTQDVNIPNATFANGGEYTAIVTDKLGCKDTIVISAFPPPNAGADVNLCAPANSTTLTGSDPNSGVWSADPTNPTGGATLGTPSNGQVSVSFTAFGTYKFIYTANNCGDTVVVNYFDANAGNDPDDVICFTNGTATLNAVLPSGLAGTWTAASGNPGSATIVNPSNATTDINGFTAPGTYTFVWTVGTCTDQVQVVVGNQCSGCLITNNNITPPTLSPLCQTSGTFNIEGSTATPAGGTYTWQYSINGGAFSAAPGTNNTEDYTVSGWGPAQYEVRRLYTVTGTNACTDTSNVFSFEVLSNPSPPFGLTATPNPVCLGSTSNLSVSNFANTTYNWTVSNPANAGLVAGTTNTATLTPIAMGSYTVSVTRTTDGCESSAATITVMSVMTPPTPENITPNNPTSCGGSNGSIIISGLAPSTQYTVNYTRNNIAQSVTLTSNGSGVLTISNLNSGTYANFTLSIGLCTSGANAGPFVLTDPNAPPIPSNISATGEVICENTTTVISVTNNPGATYTWTSSNPSVLTPQSNSTTNTITMIGLAPGTSTVSVTQSLGGCVSAAATILITVNDSPTTPTSSNTSSINPSTCSGTDGSISFSGYSPNTSYTVTYVINGNTINTNVTSNGSGIITITGLSAGSYSGFVIDNTNNCPSGTFNGPVTLSDPGNTIPTNFVASPNPVCLGYSVNLSVLNVPNAVYTWTASSTEAGLNSSTTSTTVMTPTSAGTYTISVTQTVAGCTSPPAIATILVRDDCYSPDFGVTFVNIPLTGNLKTNDDASDSEYNDATAWSGNPSSCTPVINSNGTYTFNCSTPGEYNYYVQVCLDDNCKNVPLQITVLEEMSVDNPPVANHDYINTKTNTAVYINVTSNDKCQSIPSCSFGIPSIISSPQHGTYNPSTGIYTPSNGFSGVDSFLYRVCQTPTNASSNCDEEWVYIMIFPTFASNFTNGMDDYAQTPLNTPINASISNGAKSNDVDVEGHTTNIAGFTKTVAGRGTMVLNANGSYTFTPANGYIGPVDFAYEICDSGNPTACDSATIHILVESQLPTANIGDFVWHDTNGNGVQNPGEQGIAGTKVELFTSLGNLVATTTTNSSGFYQFLSVNVGDYYLKFTPSDAEYSATFSGRGTVSTDSDITGANGLNTTSIITLVAGETNNTYDAGFYKCASIGDVVWYDTNKNDIQNSTENGINGMEVRLYRNHFGTWMLWDTKATGHKPGTPSDDGYYKFCAPPGSYYIQVIMPPNGLVRARPFIGGNVNLDSDLNNANGPNTTNVINLTSGQVNMTIDAGFYPQATAGNLVWIDENQDGIQNIAEPVVPNVLVQAYEVSTNQMVADAITDNDGLYTISNLNQEQIYLKFTPPTGYFATYSNLGDDKINSDVDHTFGLNTTRAFKLSSGSSNSNIDMGLTQAGVLPLRWLNLGVTAKADHHKVHWSTTAEVNTDYFIVERRLESEKEFIAISDKIKSINIASLTNNYDFIDRDVNISGLYEYKIKQVDLDGKFRYSDIVSTRNSSEGSINIYPNPTSRYASVEIDSKEETEVGIIIADYTGKIVRNLSSGFKILKGNNHIEIDLNNLVSGVYNISVNYNSKTITKMIVKN